MYGKYAEGPDYQHKSIDTLQKAIADFKYWTKIK